MKKDKIRVLQVITNLGTGGAEKLLVDSIPIYIEKKINMDLLLLNGFEHPFYEYLEKRNIKIFNLGKGSVYNPLHIFHIIPYLRKYDIVHVHLFPTLYLVALAKIISLSKVKLIFTEHSTSNKRIGKRIWRYFDSFMYRNYNKIVSITSEVDQAIKTHLNIKNTQIFQIINNGINLLNFTGDISPVNKSLNERVLIQISSFNRAKDQATVIRALKLLPENVFLLLVGEGEMKQQCELLVKDLALSERVKFLGIRTDIPQLIQSSDIAILSSHVEGFGLSAVEGMASGKPFIASDVPGLNNVVRGAGILFTLGDEKALASEVQKLLSDEQYYIKTAKVCHERAKNYDINRMVDKYIDLYNELIN